MARYIDVDELIQGLKCAMDKILIGTDNAEELTRLQLNDTIEWLDSQPTADVVEVVRCKDCYYRNTISCNAKHERSDMDYCSHGLPKRIYEQFSSYGERKGADDA